MDLVDILFLIAYIVFFICLFLTLIKSKNRKSKRNYLPKKYHKLPKRLKKSAQLHFTRELEEEQELSQNQLEKINNQEPEIEESRIVKFLKPIGFFTKLIFSERADIHKAMLDMQKEKGGYWQKYVKASKKKTRSKGPGARR